MLYGDVRPVTVTLLVAYDIPVLLSLITAKKKILLLLSGFPGGRYV